MADYLVSHEATITLVAGAATPGVPTPVVPKSSELAEVGLRQRGRRIVRSTPHPQDPIEYRLGAKDGSGYLDVFVDETTAPPFPDGVPAILTAKFNLLGDTTNTITGTVMLHNMRHAPLGLASLPGKQRVRYDWRGVLA